MILTDKKKGGLPIETVTMAEITDVTFTPSEEKADRCLFKFKIPSGEELVKEYPASLDDKSLLRRDIQTVLGRGLMPDELENGYDPKDLKGKKAVIVVMLKSAAGGRPVPGVGPLFDLKKIKDVINALN